MLGWIDIVVKNIKEKYWITYDPNKFTFCMAKWDKLEKDGWKIVELVFTYDITGQVLRIPYQFKLDFQKFLSSWDLQEVPKWQKLIS